MAHPASERVLTASEISVIASALASYERECMQEAKTMRRPSLHTASQRRDAEAVWSDRAIVAHGLYLALLPVGSNATVTVRS